MYFLAKGTKRDAAPTPTTGDDNFLTPVSHEKSPPPLDIDDDDGDNVARFANGGHLLPPPVTSASGNNIASGSSSNPASPTKEKASVHWASRLTSHAKRSTAASNATKKSARIAEHGVGLRGHWARFKKRMGQTADDSSPSDSGLETGESAETGETWSRLREAQDRAEAARTSGASDAGDEGPVDEIVVDRVWQTNEFEKLTESDETRSSPGDKSGGGTGQAHGAGNGTATDHESGMVFTRPEGFWGLCLPLTLLRYRFWPSAVDFFSCRFYDERQEEHYTKEIWFSSKPLALWSSLFYVLNWVLGCALVPKPFTLGDNIFYFGVAPVLTLPIPFMVMFDFPRRRKIFYHVFVLISTWSWAIYQVLFIFICGYYSRTPNSCGTKDFLSLFYYTSALQTIALFGLKLNRFPAMLGATVFLVMSAAMVIPFRIGWIRNDLNFVAFQAFLLYVGYMKEMEQRRLFTLRDQLKVQFKATQRAQVNERKAWDSKRRLTSYVFHDKLGNLSQVRVPLNTALIAVQNMEASGTVARDQEVEFKALEGSLSMMSKVLNDVLDFNRMDSGRFESVSRPYAFHQTMRSMFVPLQLATDARGLEFVTELDPAIDMVAKRAALEALSHKVENISGSEEAPSCSEDGAGIVVGDEMRLRQIITNLASNACKFTPAGGKLTIKTKLVLPHPHPVPATLEHQRRHRHNRKMSSDSTTEDVDDIDVVNAEVSVIPMTLEPSGATTLTAVDPCENAGPSENIPVECILNTKTLIQHNATHGGHKQLDTIVVRIEVSDTGYGIRKKDIEKGKLFSAFNQTEQGRTQGGKGTGLGLALVRQIVKLSGGRLGLQSRVGQGSTFWVEIPLGVGKKAVSGTVSSESAHPGSGGSEVSSSAFMALSKGYNRDSSTEREPSRGRSNAVMPSVAETSSDTAVDRSSRNSYAPTSSALKGIMEQGGLVELASTKLPDGDKVPTRTIGDPSTGTELFSDVLTPSPSDTPEQTDSGQPTISRASTSTPTIRPSYVELPKRPTFAPAPLPIPTPSQDSNASGPSVSTPRSDVSIFDPPIRVLVVDDDHITRKLMKRMLTRLGCDVSTAENGLVALELIMGEKPTPMTEPESMSPSVNAIAASTSNANTPSSENAEDDKPRLPDPRYEVIFLDNQMPVMSGLETVAKMRAACRTDLVVGVTGNALLSDQEAYMDAGVDHVITKPVFERSLKSMLSVALDRRKRPPEPPSTPP